jgi:hypothetical protein
MCAVIKPSSDPLDLVTATADLPPGPYRVFIERVAQGPPSNPAAPAIQVRVDGATLESPGTAPDGGWQWTALGTFDKQGPSGTTVQVGARETGQHPESFAAFSRILFRKWDGKDSPEHAELVVSRGRLTVRPGSEVGAAIQPHDVGQVTVASAWTDSADLSVWGR